MISRLIAVAALALPIAAQEAKLPSPDEVAQKAVQARGGAEKMKAIKTVKMTGKIVIGGGQMEAPMTMTMKRPGSTRMEMTMQGKSLIRAFDGASAWMINPFQGGGEPQPISEDETSLMRDTADMDGPFVDPKDKGVTIEVVGKEDVEGSPAYKVKVTRKSGRVEYHWLDAQSWMPIKTQAKIKQMGQEMEIESYPGNFKPVAGVMMPFSIDQKVGGRSMAQMTMENVEVNQPVDDKVFKMPVKEAAKEEKK